MAFDNGRQLAMNPSGENISAIASPTSPDSLCHCAATPHRLSRYSQTQTAPPIVGDLLISRQKSYDGAWAVFRNAVNDLLKKLRGT